MDAKEEKTVNILLLGPSGVGKSTFINAFFNYTKYESLEEAKNNGVQCLIATKFILNTYDKKGNCSSHSIILGEDKNESLELGESATQGCKSYVFTITKDIEQIKIRLIDTPGVGDTRGVNQDERNFENILNFLSRFEYLHAICILLKPDESRLNPHFEFCLNRLFCQLEKSAAKNIVFALTRTRGTSYRPGDTHASLNKLLDRIAKTPPYIRIEASVKKNTFCFENEPFRYLAGLMNNVPFSNKEKKINIESWVKSSEECWRMLEYVMGKNGVGGLTPHLVKSTMSVNNARKLILQVSRPMAEITQVINDNILNIERQQQELDKDGQTVEELKMKLYMPQTNVKVMKLNQPVTVCGGPKCMKQVMVNDRITRHFGQRCHNPCYLTNVQKELIGDPNLLNCTAMSGTNNCKMCLCPYQLHMHIYYETEIYEDNITDENTVKTITTKEQAVQHAKDLVEIMLEKKLAYEKEQDVIVKSLAKFSHFLARNAILPYHDSYKQYFQYLIDREHALGDKCDSKTVANLRAMMATYDEEKRILDAVLSSAEGEGDRKIAVTADDVKLAMEKLYALKLVGPKIKEATEIQCSMQEKEIVGNNEYVHDGVLGKKVAGRGKVRQNQVAGQRRPQQHQQQQRIYPLLPPPYSQFPLNMNPPPPYMHTRGQTYAYGQSECAPKSVFDNLKSGDATKDRKNDHAKENTKKNLLPDNTVILSGLPASVTKETIIELFEKACKLNGETLKKGKILIFKDKESGEPNGNAIASFDTMKTAEFGLALLETTKLEDKLISARIATAKDNIWTASFWNKGPAKRTGPIEPNSVLVSGLPSGTTLFKLAELFKETCEKANGDTKALRIWFFTDPSTKQNNGMAKVTCANQLEAHVAVGLLDGFTFGSKRLKVRMVNDGETYESIANQL